MNHMRKTGVCCTLLLLALRTYSAPVATAQITSEITSEDAIFTFDGSGTADNTMQFINSYIRMETDEITPLENTLDGFGNLSNSISGASAFADINDISVVNNSLTDRFPGAANSTSMTTAHFYYDVENVSTVSFSPEIETSIQLLSESSNEYAYAYVEQSLGLFSFQDNNISLLNEYHYFDERGVTDGDVFDATQAFGCNIFYDFGNVPFSGQLFIESTSMAYTDVQGQETADVPEPTISSLLILGMGFIATARKRRRPSTD